MFPIDEAAVWERRDAAISAQRAYEAALRTRSVRKIDDTANTLAQVAIVSSDDVPILLDALVQVYGDLLSERHAIDETMDATDSKLAAVVWAREQSERVADSLGQVRHG